MTEYQRSILSAEEGKSFMLKNVFYKSVSATPFLPASFLYEPRRQNHDIIQFGDTIILQAYIKIMSKRDTQIQFLINL